MSNVAVPTTVVVPEVVPTVPPKRHFVRYSAKKGWKFLGWTLSGFGLFSPSKYKLDEITLWKVPRAFFLWFVILVGFIGATVVRHDPHAAVTVGWIYLFSLFYTFLLILYDLSPLMLMLISLVIGFIWLLSNVLEGRNIFFLSIVVGHLRDLHPALSANWVSAFSWLLGIPWLCSIVHTFGWGRIKISPNGIEEWHFTQGTEVEDRNGLKVRTRYYDLFESILGFGAGTLEASRGEEVVKKYENVLLLFWRWKRLDSILHQRAATIDNSPNDAVEVEDVNIKPILKR